MFSSNENIYIFQMSTIFLTWQMSVQYMFICLVQMSVQYNWLDKWVYVWQYMFKWVYNILEGICLVQMGVQYSWQYMFSSNGCTIYLTIYV